jgi:ankyrin repeat protein
VKSKAVVKVLLLLKGYCTNVDTADNNKTTPLHLAAKKGFPAVLELLLDRGADITLKDYKNRNALEIAIEKNQR